MKTLFLLLFIWFSSASHGQNSIYDIDQLLGDGQLVSYYEGYPSDTANLVKMDSFAIQIIPAKIEEYEKIHTIKYLKKNADPSGNKTLKIRERYTEYCLHIDSTSSFTGVFAAKLKFKLYECIVPAKYHTIHFDKINKDTIVLKYEKIVEEADIRVIKKPRNLELYDILPSGYWTKPFYSENIFNYTNPLKKRKRLIKRIQEELNARGYELRENGNFNKATAEALRQYEIINGLKISRQMLELETLKSLRVYNYYFPSILKDVMRRSF